MNPSSQALTFFQQIILPQILCAETSSAPHQWTPHNIFLGHCVPVSLYLNDVLGGDIVRCRPTLPDGTIDKHYFNRLPAGDMDLTRGQYPAGTVFDEAAPHARDYSTTRDFLLSNPDTVRRYTLFLDRLRPILKKENFSLSPAFV